MMEFISAEDFLKQDKKVQEVFIEWWKPSIGDLVFDKRYLNSVINCLECRSKASIVSKNKDVCYPLLTESQLRQFIEDKTGGPLEFEYKDGEIKISIYAYSSYPSYTFEKLGTNLFKAYWKVAVEIASLY